MHAVHHVAIQVVDLPGMEAFYRAVFGLPVIQRWSDGKGGERSVWLGLEGAFLALEKVEPSALPPRGEFADAEPGYHVLALRIARGERPSWEERLARAEVAVERRTPFSLFFRDPEGNRLAVSHHPEAAD